MEKSVDIKIRKLTLKITVGKRDVLGRTTNQWYNETFLTMKDLILFLKNFLENEYLTNLKGDKIFN